MVSSYRVSKIYGLEAVFSHSLTALQNGEFLRNIPDWTETKGVSSERSEHARKPFFHPSSFIFSFLLRHALADDVEDYGNV